MTESGLSLINRARAHSSRGAICDSRGEYSYQQLLDASGRVAGALLEGEGDLGEARVAFRVCPGFEWVAVAWGIWRAGGIAVPLAQCHPLPEIRYVLEDTGARIVVADRPEELEEITSPAGCRLLSTYPLLESATVREAPVEESRRAMILYTSGTTGRPKGVVLTHANLVAQIRTLIEAWEWSPRDRILHVLPLHHTHGIVNILLCALWAGATCEMMTAFDAGRVWERFLKGGLTLFMAVPTIYHKLLRAWESQPALQRELGEACCRMRLMVSGSAALPVDLYRAWQELSGHALLERYGMTEIGMALSNPLRGERRPGSVGTPLPGVEVRLVDEGGRPIPEEERAGEIEVRGPGVFLEYWGRPQETAGSFRQGWFRTGDQAVIERGYFRILGRQSVDIIKTGGYKVSALEIEGVLSAHPAVEECAVVGLEDAEWGELVCAAVVARSGQRPPALEEFRAWARRRLAGYKVPRRLDYLPALPRNAMGKITKPKVKEILKRNHETV